MKIKSKAFLFILLLSISLLGVFALFIQWSLAKGMIEYVNAKETKQLSPIIQQLSVAYQKSGSWKFIKGENRYFQKMLRDTLEGSAFEVPKHGRQEPPNKRHKPGKRPPPRPPHDHKLRDHPPRGDHQREPQTRESQGKERPPKVSYAIVDKDKDYVIGSYPDHLSYSYTPIIVENNTVGFFAVSKREKLTEGYELEFIAQQKSYLWMFAGGIFVIALIIALPLARYLLKPLQQLAQGMHELTQGHYSRRLIKQRNDELGQLAQDYNELAKTLDSNETARKRWLANISHELRTPVAILNGEIEAMLDGIRPFNQDNLNSLHQEIDHLKRLISDLNALTSADIGGMTYRKAELDLCQLVSESENKYHSFVSDYHMALSVEISCASANILADSTRLHQLLDNLIGNCTKYAGNQSQIKISVALSDVNQIPASSSPYVSLAIEDSGPGVSDEHLPHLFEHLYRVDDSRNRDTGGTGLGLSICAHIVAAHDGKISASRSTLGGLSVNISLPLA